MRSVARYIAGVTGSGRSIAIGILVVLLGIAGAGAVKAAEGGTSLYLPGSAGDLLIAVPPAPGAAVSDGFFIQSGNVSAAVLQGAVNLGVDLELVLNIIGASYTFETPVDGLTYTVGMAVPFGYAELSASITGPLGGVVSAKADTFDIADIALTPVALNWSVGNFHFRLAEVIIAPTGAYDTDRVVNIGRNYWAFDTVGAVTYFDPLMGIEMSVAPGVMFNTRNDATDYLTGTEFHLDFTASKFIAPNFALGIRGYYYTQLSGDEGSGARLGSFKSESFGIGPGFFWQPGFAGGKLSIVGKYMRDLTATNRFKSDYGTVGAAWKF